MRLDRKTALITGGASNIGKATVLEFARCGATVICGDVNGEKGVEIGRESAHAGLAATFAQMRGPRPQRKDDKSAICHAFRTRTKE